MTPVVDRAVVAANIAAVSRRIEAAGGRGVEVLAVTKGFGGDAVAAAAAAGCTTVGENYAQELRAKREAVTSAGVAVYFIGQLQTNKVRAVAGLVAVWASVDRRRLITELARRDPGARVLVQVDATGEPGKGGCPIGAAADIVAAADAAGLRVEGLMTVGPTSGESVATAAAFRTVRALVDELGLAVCSMGMTADLEIAVAEGSTQVRLGTALFGRRPPP